MLSRLRQILSRLRRRDPIRIELDVVEQLILRHLIRFETAPALDLVTEVLNAQPEASNEQVQLSLTRLESLRLIERDATPQLEVDEGGRAYGITSDGKRLRRVLPAEPSARIQTFL